MAWNEPGSGKQRDPWGDRGGGGPSPDFDAILKQIRNFFNGLFGGGSGGGGNGGGKGGAGGFLIAALGIVIAWVALDSWTLIDARQAGVVLRFGQFTRTMAPGFNLKWPRPIETVDKVDATQVRATSDQVRVLTKDENIVLVDFNVQYQVADPKKFLFSVRDPDETLKAAAESAVREVIGANGLDSIMPDQVVDAEGKAVVGGVNPSSNLVVDAKKSIQQTVDLYDTGLLVTELNFQNVRPPQEVKEAFDDAISAREDRQRRSNEADAYAKRIVPEARGDSARIGAAANGYKSERIAKAQGDAERFELIQTQYKGAPEVTRKRLYLETMQDVVGEMPKVIDMSGGKNLLYLPISADGKTPAPPAESAGAAVTATPDSGPGAR